MADTASTIGSLVSIWRYPVKSMMGEELNATEIQENGLLGDRTYALVDKSTGKVISAKYPRKWGTMFDCRAALVESPQPGQQMPAVKITLPDGTETISAESDHEQTLSSAFERAIGLETVFSKQPASSKQQASYDYDRPDLEEISQHGEVTEEAIPVGTFFDAATVHLLTTASLDQLQAIAPASRFETRRFRPNLVISPIKGDGFIENEWVGQTLAIGEAVRLQITDPCGRCVMTTLPQGELAPDLDVLRTAMKHNQGNVGVYATVVQGGRVKRGDTVRLISN